jgi:ABC-type nitrate/sulfonate/bicarbonate transport system substrate-binding protein
VKAGRVILAAAGALLALGAAHAPAFALDKLRAAKSVDLSWEFVSLDIGVEEGIFAKYNLDVDVSALAGDAKLQQALTSSAVDIGLGSGPSMAFTVKGSPVIAVAAFDGAPRNVSVTVAADSPIKTVADLKGKLIAVTTVGSLTDWLAKQIAIQEGWGQDGIRTIALGAFEAIMSAAQTHQIDAFMVAMEKGYQLEELRQGRIVTGMEKFAPKFHTHVILARKELVASHPDVVSRFLKGFFASVDFMRANKEKTSRIAERVLHMSPTVASKTYDYEMSAFSTDGHFDPGAIEVLKTSFVGMHILESKPADDQLFITQFLPVRP